MQSRSRTVLWAALALVSVIALTVLLGVFGSSDSLSVGGIGNNGNRIYADVSPIELAELLIDAGVADTVDDALLADIWTTLVERARAGELDAAVAILRVAELQRQETDEP